MPQYRLAGWKTDAGRRRYLEAYHAALKLWTAPCETPVIPTRFGSTRAVVSGPSDAPPLLLLPAASGIGALQWYPNIADLCAEHRVLALDFVAGPGGGTQTRAMIDRDDYTAWVTDILDHLDVDRARLVGSSQGGWFVLNFCSQRPSRVEAAALLAPAASLVPFSPIAALSLRLPPPPAWVAKPSLRAILGPDVRVDDRIVDVMALGLKHFRYQQRAVIPDVFGDTALSTATAPILVLIGDQEIIYEPRHALARAEASLPQAQTELVPGAGHLLNLQMPEEIDDRLLSFFASLPHDSQQGGARPSPTTE
jgi:pimeloyl-ACP methyl ester carboxylesterase